MLPRINEFARGAKLLTSYVYLGTDEKLLKSFDKEHSLSGYGRFLEIGKPAEAIEKLKLPNKDGKLTAMPSVMIVDIETKEILFWEEGFNLAIDQTLQQVLELIRAGKKQEQESGK